jgi:hypothetical protein
MVRPATFTVHSAHKGRPNFWVKFYKDDITGKYVVDVQGFPALKVSHPSRERAIEAFKGYYAMTAKDYGATKVDYGDMFTEQEKADLELEFFGM